MISGLKVTAIIAGAGSSSRMGFDKLMYKINGVEIARLSTAAMENNRYVDDIIYVAGENINDITEMFDKQPVKKPFKIIKGGASRQVSVKLGVNAAEDADIIAIHDGARPFAADKLISRAVEAGLKYGGAAPALMVKDTIKVVDSENIVVSTPYREALRGVQTPQVFMRELYKKALSGAREEEIEKITDDCSLFELAGLKVFLCPGDEKNVKITTVGDLDFMENKIPRIGHGYDVHKLVEGRRLIMGGVEIPFKKGLLGHSDADVLLHSLSDALLGAAALGDIGKHFPDTDDNYKNADSLVLLEKIMKLLAEKKYSVVNIDATILCQRPKLKDYIMEMRKNIAAATGCDIDAVSVKATTEEGLGYVGRSEGIAAHCVVLIK